MNAPGNSAADRQRLRGLIDREVVSECHGARNRDVLVERQRGQIRAVTECQGAGTANRKRASAAERQRLRRVRGFESQCQIRNAVGKYDIVAGDGRGG